MATDTTVAVVTLGEYARQQVCERLRVFAAALIRAREPEEEHVHQVRVATRRLQAALRVFGNMIPNERKLRRRARRVLRAAGDVRSCDISEKLLRDSGLATDNLLAKIAKERKRAESALREAVDSNFPAAVEGDAEELESKWLAKLGL